MPAPARRWPWVAGIFAALIVGYAVGTGVDPADHDGVTPYSTPTPEQRETCD